MSEMAFRKTLTLFMIDDSLYDRKLFGEIIKTIDTSIKLITFESGKKSISYFDSLLYVIPQYIFLDVNMPELDGIETLKELKKIEVIKSIPIYMYSTGEIASYGESAKLLGAAGCL